MPRHEAIVEYWREVDPQWLGSWHLGWGTPFCFACSWRPPLKEQRRPWSVASSWLHRAHLQCHVVAGDDSPANLVMLCHICHAEMPEFDERDDALEWVKAHPRADMGWQTFTDTNGMNVSAGPRTMFKFAATYWNLVAQMQHKTLQEVLAQLEKLGEKPQMSAPDIGLHRPIVVQGMRLLSDHDDGGFLTDEDHPRGDV